MHSNKGFNAFLLIGTFLNFLAHGHPSLMGDKLNISLLRPSTSFFTSSSHSSAIVSIFPNIPWFVVIPSSSKEFLL
jgi:hypothetical protein